MHNLLGKDPIRNGGLLSNELQSRRKTPPCFLFHRMEDKAVPVENSLMFAAAAQERCVSIFTYISRQPRGASAGK